MVTLLLALLGNVDWRTILGHYNLLINSPMEQGKRFINPTIAVILIASHSYYFCRYTCGKCVSYAEPNAQPGKAARPLVASDTLDI